jgi:hypothetical protein
MRDIHYGREQLAPLKGPNTDARDQSSPDHHIQLATNGRSIQICHFYASPSSLDEAE